MSTVSNNGTTIEHSELQAHFRMLYVGSNLILQGCEYGDEPCQFCKEQEQS